MAEEKKTTKKTTKTVAKKEEPIKEVKKTSTSKSKTSSNKTTKTSSTATKSTPKKVVKKEEEVASEKHFCTSCGRELNAGEVCNCKDVINVNVNTEAIADMGHNFVNTVINMFKKPATTLDETVKKNDSKASIIMLIAIAISFGLCITAGFTSIISVLSTYSKDYISYFEIPYFRIFLYMTLIYFILAFIPITAAYIVSKLTNNHDFDYKKSISLYATSMAPTIVTNLLMALLYFLNILSWVGNIIAMVISIACFFHYMLGYINVNKISENKKSYALTSLVIIWIVTFIIALFIFTGSLVSDLSNDFGTRDNSYNYNNIFK
ncbi:MAG: YIP1 family protein [Ruminococcus sp.]|nr:YIP1 family protein [Ruminococcus sp.]